MLRQHGLAQEVCDAVVQLALRLRGQTLKGHRRDRREYAALVDVGSGEQVGPLCVGPPHGVDIRPSLAAAQGREVVSIHTHPGDSSFSPRDVQVFLAEPAMKVLVVIGAAGTWYVLSVDDHRTKDPALVYVVEGRYEDEALRVAGVYRALRARGVLTRAQAWREQSHEAWSRIALELRLRYDRVEPGFSQ